MKTYAEIKSQYYLLNSKHNTYDNIDDAWMALKQYVQSIYTNSNKETIIFDENQKIIRIVTKDKTLVMNRYVPIDKSIDINDLNNNL